MQSSSSRIIHGKVRGARDRIQLVQIVGQDAGIDQAFTQRRQNIGRLCLVSKKYVLSWNRIERKEQFVSRCTL